MIGVWRVLAALAVADGVLTGMLMILANASPMVIAIAFSAWATGAAMIAAIAFWARDRWLNRKW